ncbi:MAG TPA: iron ABC transporter permease [Steroidobacteraceae bacterium]|nr:iron ABC transporter permease [Steroidobacteraceae bacterium]
MSKSKSWASTGLAAGSGGGRRGRVALLITLAAAVAVISLFSGSANLGAAHTLRALLGGADVASRSIVIDLRLPRLAAGFAVGGLLALAGVLLQALFRNALADPYVLGVSGGAAVGAILAMTLGAAMLIVQTAAVCGALGAMIGVYVLARGGSTARLLLVGVAVASACGALVSVLLSASDAARLRGMLFWLAGDLEWAGTPLASLLVALIAVAGAVLLARPLNVLAAGELRARSVGLELDTWRLAVYLAAAVLTAVAVVSAGMIGFVGLITPHTVRVIFRTSDHRLVAPVSALLGGTLLAAADLIARTATSPRQLPVGAVTALVGAPVFILLVRSTKRAVR